MLGIDDYFHYVLSVQSDPMLVTMCLAAIDCYLYRRFRWAWWLLALAALGRPEVWPFAGLYAIWCFIKIPKMRWMLYVGVLVNAFLWFGVPEITNGRPNIAGQLALKSPRELHSNKIVGTFDRYAALDFLPLELAALLGMVMAYLRRNWVYLTLGASVLVWVAVEIAFALHGFPGVPRYLFEPAGPDRGAGRRDARLAAARRQALQPVAAELGRYPAGGDPGRGHGPGRHQPAPDRAQGPPARARADGRDQPAERDHQLARRRSKVLECGRPVTNVEYVSIMAWYTHQNTGKIGHRPQFELRQKYPIVMFTPLPNGWAVQAYRYPAGHAAQCAASSRCTCRPRATRTACWSRSDRGRQR